ncbi:MAG: DJ-1/PfpI family protein, partial [Flavobacteriales bacterium]|nr:DJ-1/PfpI family protein [Flavobacteriales bacterium]
MKKSILLVLSTLALFTVNFAQAQNNKVLFVMSEADTLLLNKAEKKRQTGVFLNEFYMTYKAIAENGFSVDFATPTGKRPTIDQESLDDDYWKDHENLKEEAISFWNNDPQFQLPMTLEQASNRTDEYIGLVIPGGQGLMVDLINHKNIPLLLRSFAESNKAIGLICHAPALISTFNAAENPFEGY